MRRLGRVRGIEFMAMSDVIQTTQMKRTLSFLILGQKGGKNRIDIIDLLRDRPYNINQMADRLDLNYRTIKHHIEILTKHQLITSSQTGRYGEVFFLSPDLEGSMDIYEGIVKKIDSLKKLTDYLDSPLFFKNVLHQTYEGVIIIDPEWDVFFWNESASRIFGYSNEEILHGPLNILSDENSLKKLKDKLSTSRRLVPTELEGKKKNEEKVDISITIDQIDDIEKNKIGYLLFIRDITENKITAKALYMAEKEISCQRELAIIGQMARGVGYELYDPLASIKNATYFLDLSLAGDDPDIKETIEILKRETNQSESIIKTLLDFASTRSMKFMMIDVHETIRKALSRTNIPKSIKTSIKIPRSLPKINADPEQLEDVIERIIQNAVQAMSEGGRITIGLNDLTAKSLSIYIRDTGEGIPEESLVKVFDPLFTTKPKGVGLGLSIAKKIMEAHSGTIELRNAEGGGCMVTLTLPINMEEGL